MCVITVAIGALLLAPTQTADAADRECNYFDCNASNDGIVVEAQQVHDVKNLVLGPNARAAAYRKAAKRPTSESTLTPGCPGNDPNRGGPYDVACVYLSGYCQSVGQPGGSLTWVWRRPVLPTGKPAGRWARAGMSCNLPAEAVRAVAGPGVPRAMIERAFRDLPFARPGVHVQPEGNVTLVNLPTYYQVLWPTAGYAPGEVAAVTLLGRTVRIKPAAKAFTYTFGDGHELGPTTDVGGTYPSGNVRHTYSANGSAPVSMHATYTGQYSLDGSTWQDIDVTVPISGPATTVQIRQARSRLVAGSS